MRKLTFEDYDQVEDIIEEILYKTCDIKSYCASDILNSDDEFICGSINYVKRNENHNGLLHNNSNDIWEDLGLPESYNCAVYYKVSELEKFIPKLTRCFYYNEFL